MRNPSSRDTRILVVDDDPIILKLMKALLSKHYSLISLASSATEATKLLSQSEFHCIITDAIMPQVNGYEFTRTVRNHPQWKHIPILMLTRKRHPEDVQKAIKAGVNDYLLKPIDEHLLLDKVALCVNRTTLEREVFELDIIENTELTASCQVLKISESGLTIATPFAIYLPHSIRLSSDFFKQMGIDHPTLRLIDTHENPVNSKFPYVSRFNFVAVSESDLMKIRSWIQRETIRRKK